MKRFLALLLSALLVLTLASCSALPLDSSLLSQDTAPVHAPQTSEPSQRAAVPQVPEKDGFYYDLEQVVLYLDAYGQLPPNYITKDEARRLGWQGGSVEDYQKGAAIGGDRFGNREGLLPSEQGRTYTECDLDTQGQPSRGAKRLVFSNDGLYFYTEDHYESFDQVFVEEGDVLCNR